MSEKPLTVPVKKSMGEDLVNRYKAINEMLKPPSKPKTKQYFSVPRKTPKRKTRKVRT